MPTYMEVEDLFSGFSPHSQVLMYSKWAWKPKFGLGLGIGIGYCEHEDTVALKNKTDKHAQQFKKIKEKYSSCSLTKKRNSSNSW